jgi:hypothetical protein
VNNSSCRVGSIMTSHFYDSNLRNFSYPPYSIPNSLRLHSPSFWVPHGEPLPVNWATSSSSGFKCHLVHHLHPPDNAYIETSVLGTDPYDLRTLHKTWGRYMYNEQTNAHLTDSFIILFIVPTCFNANESSSGRSYSMPATLHARRYEVTKKWVEIVSFIDTFQILPQHVSAIHCHHQGVVVPQKLLKQYLCCGCIWIMICPGWPVVRGCDQAVCLIYAGSS